MDAAAESTERLSRARLALYAAPCLPLAGIGLPMIALLPTYYAQVLGLSLSAVGGVFMVVRLLDIGLDPILGVLMDRTRTPWGRFRPWLAAGAPVMMAAVAWLFFARRGVGPAYLGVGIALAYVGWSICVLAQSAWGALLSPSYHERSRIYSWWQTSNLIGLLIAILTPVLAATAGFSRPQDGMAAMGWVLLLQFPLTFAPSLIGVPESRPAEGQAEARLADWLAILKLDTVRRVMLVDLILGLSFGMQASLFLFYLQAVKGMAPGASNILLLIYFVSGLLCGPLWTRMAKRIDKHRALAASSLFYLLGLAGFGLFPAGRFGWAAAVAVLAGVPYSAPNLLSRSMLADAGDAEKLQARKDRTGVLYAVLNSSTKVGSALAVGATFVGLDMAGFRADSAANSQAALGGLSLMFLAGPALLNVMGAALLIGYPLTADRHAEIRAALEHDRPGA